MTCCSHWRSQLLRSCAVPSMACCRIGARACHLASSSLPGRPFRRPRVPTAGPVPQLARSSAWLVAGPGRRSAPPSAAPFQVERGLRRHVLEIELGVLDRRPARDDFSGFDDRCHGAWLPRVRGRKWFTGKSFATCAGVRPRAAESQAATANRSTGGMAIFPSSISCWATVGQSQSERVRRRPAGSDPVAASCVCSCPASRAGSCCRMRCDKIVAGPGQRQQCGVRARYVQDLRQGGIFELFQVGELTVRTRAARRRTRRATGTCSPELQRSRSGTRVGACRGAAQDWSAVRRWP